MAIVYRPIDPKNHDEVYAYTLACEYSWRDSSATYIADSDEDRQANPEALIGRLANGGQQAYCLAAFDHGTIAGAIRLDRMLIDKRPACHIQALFVDPTYRRHGVGRRLKELGEAWAKAMGCEFMDTNVRVE